MFTIGLTSIKNGVTRRFSKNQIKTFAFVQLGWKHTILVTDQSMLVKDIK
jgi:hypothetical protein